MSQNPTIPTRQFYDHHYPIIAQIDSQWDLVATPNGPGLCDSDTIMTIIPYPYDSAHKQVLKRKALKAWKDYSWKHLKSHFLQD